MLIRDFISHWRTRLADAGVEDPRLTIELLLVHVLGGNRGELIARMDDILDTSTLARLEAMCARRAAREPIDYVIGEREFRARAFKVRPGVLVPRPETELIVDLALKLLPRDTQGWAADVGCGSGVLAVTLALEFPALMVLATDISETPLKVTRENAERLGVSERVCCARMDGLSAAGGGFALVVSNPPYVNPADAPTLDPEVIDHEPHEALFGGPDGLAVAQRVLAHVAERLMPGGLLLMEHGMEQGASLREAATRAGLKAPRTHPDHAGLDRILEARA